MRVISRVQLCRMLNYTCLFDIVAAAVLKLCQDSTYSPIWSYLYITLNITCDTANSVLGTNNLLIHFIFMTVPW